MDYLIICITALLASGLTFFSGFGLGTLLMPVFAIFFPLPTAIASTAMVHLFNNLFKLILVGRLANKKIVLRFGVPAMVSAFLGAQALSRLSEFKPLITCQWMNQGFQVMPVKLVVAVLMIAFALVEIMPHFEKFSFDKKFLPVGGILSGFFGGLSGHQGALRGAFLMKCGLEKESFIATGVVIACIVDVSRISVYAVHFAPSGSNYNVYLLAAATVSAFTGAFIGKKLLKKATMRNIQIIVSAMLFGIAIGLGAGLI
ncbi:MAG: sulfite exporter TauE/SafE family protein [Nitrospinae bacterium]|nr:sulfite exporter TauE/SafE family protein [Nitrospinota bacterium]